jgi:parallel beta-helix repeat protein
MRGSGTPRLMAVLALVLAAMAAPVPGARAAHVHCGDFLTADTTLDSDLLDCPDNGVEIHAAGVTLDLGGHTIDGVRRGIGVVTGLGVSRVTVVNGTVREFNTAIRLGRGSGYLVRDVSLLDSHVGLLLTDVTGALVKRISASGIDGSAIHSPTSSGVTLLRNHLFANASGTGGIGLANSLISHNIVEDNTFYGFFYFELNGTTLEHNVIRDNGTFGISLGEASSGNRIAHNRITRSGIDGIALFEDAGPNLLVGNRSDGNADDGFDIAPAGSTLVGNSAARNGDLGFEAPLGALVATHNRARHNGNPQQCLGIPCR